MLKIRSKALRIRERVINPRSAFRRLRKMIRTLWAITGLAFLLWMGFSYQRRGLPAAVLQSDAAITVTQTSE